MSFNIRQIKDEDTVEIARWIDDRKWPMPPAENVVSRIGMIAEKNGILYASLVVYTTGLSVAFLDWPAMNPDVPTEQASDAMLEIIEHYKNMCKVSEPPISVLMFNTQSELLGVLFKTAGFRLESNYYKASWMLKD